MKLLDKGYSVVKSNDKVIKSIDEVNINDELNINLSKGKLIASVIRKEK